MMFGYLLAKAVDLYSLIMLVWVIASWFPNARRYELVRLTGRACEPLLRVARRALPATGGFDFSPVLVLFLLQLLASALRGLAL